MTILMATNYAPYRDGVAAYAIQEVRKLLDEGHHVEVVSPVPSAAHHHRGLGSVQGFAKFAALARQYDRVIIQMVPELLFGRCRTSAERAAVWQGLAGLAKMVAVEVRLHEIEYGRLERSTIERKAAQRALSAAAKVGVHTETERKNLGQYLDISTIPMAVVDHGAAFAPAVSMSQAEARTELGLPQAGQKVSGGEPTIFVSIGFLQHHKGFDRAVTAFRAAGLGDPSSPDRAANAELHIVGSVRVDDPVLLAYADELATQCQQTPGVYLHRGYVSDQQFDTWLIAADVVVLPYREIWSSSVVERAKLFGRPVIVSEVGGLAYQSTDDSMVIASDHELLVALRHFVGDDDGAPADASAVSGRRALDAAPRNRTEAQAEIDAVNSGGNLNESPSGLRFDVAPLVRPSPVSGRPGVSLIKKVIRRTIDWELDPVVRQLEALRLAMAQIAADRDRVESAPESRP